MLSDLCFSLLLLTVAAHGCTENCTVPDKPAVEPPSITEDKTAVLHGQCYSLCMNELMKEHKEGAGKKMTCDTIQSIESCQDGCLLRNIFPKKMKVGTHCINHCTSRCGELGDSMKWKKPYKSQSCPRHCKRKSCVIGCSALDQKQQNANEYKGIRLALPVPHLAPTGRNNRFSLKETKLVKYSARDQRVAMVIKIEDNSTNTTFYDWHPGLKTILDLRYFACKTVQISVKLVYGFRSTAYSVPIATCASNDGTNNHKLDGEKSCESLESEVLLKVAAIKKQTQKMLRYVNKHIDDSTTSEHLKDMINELRETVAPPNV